MEATGMKAILTLMAVLLVVGAAQASEVYKSTDAKGNTTYTDRPEVLPAEKVNVKTQQTDTVEARKRYEDEMKSMAADDQKSASQDTFVAATAEDKAKRCKDARARYESYMNARRLFEPGATEGERRYLSSEEIDATRADAKKTMDEFCSGQ
jgi:tRNA splicing endonuclease